MGFRKKIILKPSRYWTPFFINMMWLSTVIDPVVLLLLPGRSFLHNLQDHRINQKGPQHISSPTFSNLAMSWVFLVWSWRAPRMVTGQPLWAACATASHYSQEKFSPYIQSEHVLFQLIPVVSSPLFCHDHFYLKSCQRFVASLCHYQELWPHLRRY